MHKKVEQEVTDSEAKSAHSHSEISNESAILLCLLFSNQPWSIFYSLKCIIYYLYLSVKAITFRIFYFLCFRSAVAATGPECSNVGFPLLGSRLFLTSGSSPLRSRSGGQLQQVTRPGEQSHKSRPLRLSLQRFSSPLRSPFLAPFHVLAALNAPFGLSISASRYSNQTEGKHGCNSVRYYHMLPLKHTRGIPAPRTTIDSFNSTGNEFITFTPKPPPFISLFSLQIFFSFSGILLSAKSLFCHVPLPMKLNSYHRKRLHSLRPQLSFLSDQIWSPLHLIVCEWFHLIIQFGA